MPKRSKENDSRRMLKHLSAILEKSGVIIFDDRWKAIEFYSGRIKGPIDIREVDDDGGISRKRLETVSISEEEDAGESDILFGMVIDVTGEWHQEERLEHELVQMKATGTPCSSCTGYPEYDKVTGLPSFNRFREEIDNVLTDGKGEGYLLVYTDLENFKYFNRKYGYAAGEHRLFLRRGEKDGPVLRAQRGRGKRGEPADGNRPRIREKNQ